MTDSVRLTPQVPTVTAEAASSPSVGMLGWLAGAGIGGAILIMIGAALVREDWMTPRIAMPATGPPFELHVHVSGEIASLALWLSALLALGGVAAGLVAARRGARGPIGLILVAAVVSVLALAVLPPAGSTDALDYAAYGRLVLLHDNPYVATPLFIRLTDPAFGASIPAHWQHQVSLYGPAATLEQYLAAKLGGNSMARVVFWLKIWNALAFGVVAVALDRALRFRPSARLRAHLLWTINPLLLWDLVAAGHVDAAAAAAGILGLLVLGLQPAGDGLRPAGNGLQPRIWRAVAAGALIGLAADVKIDYLLFGAALAWALRRSVPALIAAAAGALAVLAPTYAWLGKPAIMGLFARTNQTTQDSFYRSVELTGWKYLGVLAALLFIAIAALLLWRLPPGDLRRPALRPAIALSLAWIVIWPYELPWYDAMVICVLVLAPASWLDWLVLVRLCAGTIANMPGNVGGVPVRSLKNFDTFLVHGVGPTILFGVTVAVVLLAVWRAWGVQGEIGQTPAWPYDRVPLAAGSSGTRKGRWPVALEITRLALARMRGVDGNEWPVHGFLVRFAGGAVLVDTGVGGPQRWLDDWRVVNRSVADALDELDLTPGDISLVINTHLHFDHCGQNAVFKRATVYVQRAELDRARRESPQLAEWFDFMNAKFELLDGDAEILPGLKVIATPGHTVGHQSVLVDSADGMSDALVGDAAYKPRQYLNPASDELPEGQASDVTAWRASVGRIREAAPDRVHFCHDTEIIHS